MDRGKGRGKIYEYYEIDRDIREGIEGRLVAAQDYYQLPSEDFI